MATITLVANTAYSALTVATGDTIALAGFALTLDVGSPTAQNVTVTAVGNAGTVVLGTPNTYTLTGWVFRAGTVSMINTIAAGKTITGASFTGGSANPSHAIAGNSGTLSFCTLVGGTVSGANGLNSNSGQVNNCTVTGAASGSGGYGINNNNLGTMTGCTVTGGAVAGANGLNANNGLVTGCSFTGGSAAGANGLNANNGSLINSTATGGTNATAHGIGTNLGVIENLSSGMLTDATGRAVGAVQSGAAPVLLTRGDNLRGAVPSGFATIYRIGAFNAAATINGSPTIVDLYDTRGSLGLGEIFA